MQCDYSIAIACCPSACPPVTLVDQDHTGWKSWKLISRTISATSSLFVAQRISVYYEGNMGKFGGTRRRVGKMAFWSTKAAISLKRVNIEKKLPWGAYRNSPSLFWTIPSPTPYGLPRVGVRTPPKTPIAIISGMGKATNFKFGQNNNNVHPNNSPWKILEKRERGRIQGLPKFFGYPHYLRNGKSYGFHIWPEYSEGPSEQKPIKKFREKGAWAYPATAHFFGYPLLSQEREKLRISNLASTFRGSIRTKAL